VKEVFEALAKYKMKVDESVLAIVENLGEDKLLAPTGAFFPTVYDQLKHLFGADVNWIKRFKLAFPKNAPISRCRFADFDAGTLKSLSAGDRGKLFADMRELDRDVFAFIGALDEAAFSSIISYKNYKGQEETHELWKALLQWFNHGTHHRGTISGQLDALGVENDFSSLLSKI
jgi:uncharacterized damage-inducible protein DinB